jgi:uncharacterized membrane protein YdjX (TVP38/TMEM64 family)
MGQEGELYQQIPIKIILDCITSLYYQYQVNEHKNNLLNYIIFLRITPFLPNWFINITSPVIGVSMSPFFFGTFLGNVYTYYLENQLTFNKLAISCL